MLFVVENADSNKFLSLGNMQFCTEKSWKISRNLYGTQAIIVLQCILRAVFSPLHA